jgi:hypothetical protein
VGAPRRSTSSSTTPQQHRGEEAAKEEDAAAGELHHAGAPIDDIDVAALPALLHLSMAMPHHGIALVAPRPPGRSHGHRPVNLPLVLPAVEPRFSP